MSPAITRSISVLQKPVIGINCDFRSATKDHPAFSYLAAGYHDKLAKAGALPIALPPLAMDDLQDQFLDLVQGMVMIGGADLDPRRDGYMLHPSVRLQPARREESDRALMAKIVERRLPVLGIGSGMQLLNVTLGGNLFLHIAEDVPKAIPHADAIDRAHRHTLEIDPGSLMGRVFGDGEIRVNSMHHMAIDALAEGFRVTARCPDGIVECIESESEDWFAVGTQFHPEADSASALDQRIFDEFVEGVMKFSTENLRLVA
jgi:putative glutamine amidotransferase